MSRPPEDEDYATRVRREWREASGRTWKSDAWDFVLACLKWLGIAVAVFVMLTMTLFLSLNAICGGGLGH